MGDSENINAVVNNLFHRVREAREILGINRSEFARRIGVKPSAAIQWEHENGTRPSLTHLMHIAVITNVAFEWLATGRGTARRSDETVSSDSLAVDLFEESLLKLSRELPLSAKAPLIALLKSFKDKL